MGADRLESATMRDPNKKRAALYGAAFHAAVVVIMIALAVKNRAPLDAHVLARAIPILLVAAAVLYFFIGGPYLTARSKRKSAVFSDALIGMVLEVAVVALTSILYALVATLPALGQGFGVFGAAFGQSSAYTLLWMFGSFFTQILVFGNAAGLVGWFVLKKLDDRAAKQAAASNPPA